MWYRIGEQNITEKLILTKKNIDLSVVQLHVHILCCWVCRAVLLDLPCSVVVTALLDSLVFYL